MAHRSFTAARERLLEERPTFDLNGEQFKCKAALSVGTLGQILENLNSDSTPSEIIQGAKVFFDKALVKADRAKMALVLDPPPEDEDDDDFVPVGVDEIVDVLTWLVEVYTGNPSESPEASGDSSDSSSPLLKPGSSSTDSDS